MKFYGPMFTTLLPLAQQRGGGDDAVDQKGWAQKPGFQAKYDRDVQKA